MNQITDSIIMVRPINFGFNPETAEDNAFQSEIEGLEAKSISEKAISEFDAFVDLLRENEIEVNVIQDQKNPFTPDSIFPNNWFTTHEDGVVITYPMASDMRRKERREDLISSLMKDVKDSKRYGFEYFEDSAKFLEGTGSMILDRENKIVYASLSVRTHVEILEKFSVLRAYRKIFFHSTDKDGVPVYHTNVMMTLGENFALICLDCVKEEKEKKSIIKSLKDTNKEIIEISISQMYQFAGNMIQLKNRKGDRFIVMSQQARASLSEKQVHILSSHGKILSPDLHTIETIGGGSARCMIAEDFLVRN